VSERHAHELKRNGPLRSSVLRFDGDAGQPSALGDVRSTIGIRTGSDEEDPPFRARYLLRDRARIGSIQSRLAGQLRVAGAGAVNRDSLWLVTPTPGTSLISADPHHFSASREDRSWCRGLATEQKPGRGSRS